MANEQGSIDETEEETQVLTSYEQTIFEEIDPLFFQTNVDSLISIHEPIDVERKRTPVIYTVEEGTEPEGFWDMVEQIAKEDPKK